VLSEGETLSTNTFSIVKEEKQIFLGWLFGFLKEISFFFFN